MAYDARAVANFFLDLAAESNASITPMKLQKLIFFAHGWHLALYEEPLIVDAVEAWQFGPVVRSVYQEFKHARNGPIVNKATSFDFDDFEIVEPKIPTDDERVAGLIRRIWDSYGALSAIQLSNMTHLPDTPWDRARKTHGDGTHIPISDESIQHYFKEELERNRARREEKAGAV